MRRKYGIMAGMMAIFAFVITASVWAQAMSDGDRIAAMEHRLARMEQILMSMRIEQIKSRNALVGRWQKIRDDGQRVFIVDSQTGRVKIIGTNAGSVRTLPNN